MKTVVLHFKDCSIASVLTSLWEVHKTWKPLNSTVDFKSSSFFNIAGYTEFQKKNCKKTPQI